MSLNYVFGDLPDLPNNSKIMGEDRTNDIDVLVDLIVNLDEEAAVEFSTWLTNAGMAKNEILAACRKAMTIILNKIEEGRYFTTHLILSREILGRIENGVGTCVCDSEILTKEKLGTIVVNKVLGDLQDVVMRHLHI